MDNSLTDSLYPLGSIHGGSIATLLDSAMACAVHSLLPALGRAEYRRPADARVEAGV